MANSFAPSGSVSLYKTRVLRLQQKRVALGVGLQRERFDQALCFAIAQQHQFFGRTEHPQPFHIQRQPVDAA